jgi:acyl carrier protein
MSSFTSSSEASPDVAWRRWLLAFVSILILTSAVLYGLLVLIDPYDSGRFWNFGISGILDEAPRTANVSRARNANFDAAVFGSSTGQLLDPTRLSKATGLSFTQLTVPGTGPREQLTVINWFAAHRSRIGALILVSDESWCTQDPALPLGYPFPFWLYGNDIEYLQNVLSWHSLELAVRRIRIALGQRSPSDPVGYSDYEQGRVWAFAPEPPTHAEPMSPPVGEMSFPWIEKLDSLIIALPPSVPVVLVMPPVYFTAIPPAGSLGALRLARCKAALARLVAGRIGSAFLDFHVDDATTRDARNFMDYGHYRASIARRMEQEIATIIRSANAAAGRQALGDDRRGNYHRLANAGLSAWGGRLDPDLRLYPEHGESGLQHDTIESRICAWCIDYLANKLKLPANRIDPHAKFSRLGVDSAMAMFLLADLEERFGLELASDSVFEHPSIIELARYVVTRLPGKTAFGS